MTASVQYETPFGDLFELEHFFEMLDEWAAAPDSARLDELCSEQSHIRQRVCAIREQVETVEAAHGMQGRHSYQFDLLTDLDSLLAEIEHPSELARDLSEVKQKLQSAQMIADEMRVDRREPAVIRDSKRQSGTQKKRGSKRPVLDAWLDDALASDEPLSNDDLWSMIPSDGFKLYRDGDEVFEDGRVKGLSRGGFGKRVTQARKRR